MRHARSPRQIVIGILSVALLAGAAAGCGSNGGIGSGIAQFAGSWHYDEARGVLACGDDKLDESPLGNKTLAAGVSADLVDLSESPIDSAIFCNFGFDVAGPVASIVPDQTCKLTGGIAELSFGANDLWTITLNGPTKAEEMARVTLTVTQPGPNVGDPPQISLCSFELVAHLTKVSKD
jgi:hypothetical protein